MLNDTHMQIDLETLGTGPRAAIIAIGACTFNPQQGITSSFEVLVDPKKATGERDKATELWWTQQEPLVRERMFSGTATTKEALESLVEYIEKHKPHFLWANSPSFDLVILAASMKDWNIEIPWSHRIERDFRTLKSLGNELRMDVNSFLSDNASKHDAREDAIQQSLVAIGILKRILR